VNDENFFHLGETSLEATFDRVLVLIDQFKSGYECSRCAGSGKVPCSDCIGGKSALNTNMTCKSCRGKMTIPCPDCDGKGGLLVVPETSQNPPQAGTIVSIGEDVGKGVQRLFGAIRVQAKEESQVPLKIGDRVMFGRFAGHDLSLQTTDGSAVNLRLLNESEILCRMRGSLEMRKVGKSVKEEAL